MNTNISALEPKEIWVNFAKLVSIPRPSKKEEKIIAYMKKFGEDLGLETIIDKVGNVIIKKPATPGMEDKMTVVLQGHLDIVPQKNRDKKHDFATDPITAYIDGEWVTADGTTLGADNGMGVAAAMGVLQATNLKHPAIEALFTIDEETGMTGAFNLEPNILDGDILINMDSEDEGELYVGCAGGTDANIEFEYKSDSVPEDYTPYKITLVGMKGGHSGLDINSGKGNAIKVIFRFLFEARKNFGLKLANIEGGNMRNAIPREAFATVVVPNDKTADFEKAVKDYECTVKKELSEVEPTLSFSVEKTEKPCCLIEEKIQNQLIDAIYATPNGVMRYSDSMPGLVETSTNLSIVKSEKGKININALIRSSVDSAKTDIENMFESVYNLTDSKLWFNGQYPGWKPNMNSAILKTMQKVYDDNFGKVPEIKAIHAGLECGLLGGIYPNWDMISFGPTIRFPHSPDEKVKIDTVKMFWDFLVKTLENIPAK